VNKFYTRQGDDGTSKTRAGDKRAKNDLLFELLGTLDESCAFLSLTALYLPKKEYRDLVGQVEKDLQSLMAEAAGDKNVKLQGERIVWLEREIDHWGEGILAPSEFLYSWNVPASALLNVARTVIRRAERIAVGYVHSHPIANHNWLVYLNRLSSLLFVLQLRIENPPQEE